MMLKLDHIYSHETSMWSDIVETSTFLVIGSSDDAAGNPVRMETINIDGPRLHGKNQWNIDVRNTSLTHIGPKEDHPEYFL